MHSTLDEINVLLSQLADQRDALLACPTFEPESYAALNALLTKTKSLMGAVVPPLSLIISRLATLREAVEAHRAAATSQEVETLSEETGVLKLELNALLNHIKSAAWEEDQAESDTAGRLALVVRAENSAMTDEAVAGVVSQAFAMARQRGAEVDLVSYVGRVRAQMPFAELAAVVNELLASGGFGTVSWTALILLP